MPQLRHEVEEVPECLKLDHESEIAYHTKASPLQVRGGTLTALVEQLTRHDRLDSDFNTTFLLTYRSFTTASELFEMLVKRFNIQPPYGLAQDDYQMWVAKKQKLIRIRVVNILKNWFDTYWMENNDEAGNHLLSKVYAFAKDSIAITGTPAGPLMTVVEQRLRGQDTSSKRTVPNFPTSAPAPIMPKNIKKLKFLDIDATEFARQLTIIESRLYAKIKPAECLNKTWQRKVAPDDPEPAANVKALILHSNQLTNWVAEMILTQPDVKKRVAVIKHFVSVADVNKHTTITRAFPFTDHHIEMPDLEQLLHSHFDHMRPWDGANTSVESHLASGQCPDVHHPRTDAQAHSQHEKFRRISGHIAFGQPTVYSFLW